MVYASVLFYSTGMTRITHSTAITRHPAAKEHGLARLTIAAVGLLASCGQPGTATQDVPTNPAAADVSAMKNDIAAVEDRVTRETLTRRVEALEKRVGALEVTPEKIDLDLLTQRVQALEGKSSVSDLADAPASGARATPRPKATATSKPMQRGGATPTPE